MRQFIQITLISLTFWISTAASAQTVCEGSTVLVDYVGYGYETGGVLPSDPGDVFAFTAVTTDLDPIFGVDLLTEEVTVYVSGLTSTGQINTGSSWLISYAFGHIEVYADPLQDADWGVFPPNAELGTFTNGTLLFEGDFSSFIVQMDLGGIAGAFEGLIDGVGGTVADACTDCAFTFGGIFGEAIAQLPDGYDLQIDGTLEVCETVQAQERSFGSIKALYND